MFIFDLINRKKEGFPNRTPLFLSSEICGPECSEGETPFELSRNEGRRGENLPILVTTERQIIFTRRANSYSNTMRLSVFLFRFGGGFDILMALKILGDLKNRAMVLMVARRSPKPKVGVQVLLALS